MAELEGRVAVITGGASGIGAATARRFAAEGATVAVIDRDGEGAVAVAAEVGGHAYAVDVRDGDEMTEVVDRVAQTLGQIDILVNNAGVGDLRPLHTVDDKLWHRLIDVNLTGTFNGDPRRDPVHARDGRRRDREQRVVVGSRPDPQRGRVLRGEGRRDRRSRRAARSSTARRCASTASRPATSAPR